MKIPEKEYSPVCELSICHAVEIFGLRITTLLVTIHYNLTVFIIIIIIINNIISIFPLSCRGFSSGYFLCFFDTPDHVVTSSVF